MLAITGVDALGRIPEEKLLAANQSGRGFDIGTANMLGNAGIDRAFKDHDRTLGDVLPERPARRANRSKVGRQCFGYRGWDRDDRDLRIGKHARIGGQVKRRCGEITRLYLTGAIVPFCNSSMRAVSTSETADIVVFG